MCESRRSPHFISVYAGDEDLAVREFQQPAEIALDVGARQALRQENNRAIVAIQGARQGIIVANRVLPFVHDTGLFEDAPANGGAAAPAEVSPFLAEHGDHRGIPRREEGSRQIAAIGNQPAHRGGRADSYVSQRSHKVMQPVLSGAAVGIGEDEYFEFRRQLFHRHPQTVHLLAGIARAPCNDHVRFHSRTRGYTIDDAARGIRI